MSGRLSAKGPILVLAETGFIVRNLLLGFFAPEILKNHELLVAVQRPDDARLEEIFKDQRVRFIEFPFESYRDSRSYFRKVVSWDNIIYSLESSRKGNKSLEIQTRLFEGHETDVKVITRMLFVFVARIIRFIGLSAFLRARYLNSYIQQKPVTQKWIGILAEYRPSVVLTTMLTHSIRYRPSSDLPVAVAAQVLNIPVCTLVQSWDNLSSKTSLLPGWVSPYFTWSQFMSKELLQYNPHLTQTQVIEVGSPQYDFHQDSELLVAREHFLESLGLDHRRPYVLIGTGTAKWMPDEPEKVVDLVSRIRVSIPDLQVLVRLHPKDNGLRWGMYLDKLRALNASIQISSPETPMDLGGFVPPRDFYEQQVNAVYHSACVINSSSSLTVDAAILDRPVVCIGYDLEFDSVFPDGRAFSFSQSNHYQHLVSTGGVAVVRSPEECVSVIGEYLTNPEKDREGRLEIVKRVKGGCGGPAGIVLAREVLKVLEER